MVILDSCGMNSSWINMAYLVRENDIDETSPQHLALEFNNGTTCYYFRSDEEDYKDICESSSPGKWLNNWHQLSNYRTISL